uniref:Uncharacterized protein n=1 Tax=Ceratitis capitata TaxID=7213 RepID=W8AYR1_CERCA
MAEGVTPDVTQAPTAARAKINNDNKNVVNGASAPAATMTKKTCGNKSVNKPKQGWRNPTNASAMRRNVTKPNQQLPDYIRTEMEILRHLNRVNRDLRILLTAKCGRTPNTTPRLKYYQAVRQSAGGVGQRVGGVNCMKSQNFLTKASAAKSKSVVLKQTKPSTSTGRAQVDSTGTAKKQMDIRLEAQGTGRSTPKMNKRPLQRLVLYFKPKRKDDDSKGTSQGKQPKVVNKTEKQFKTESAMRCKSKMDAQQQVKQTPTKMNEQNNKGQSKKAEIAVKELEEFKENLKAKAAMKVTDKVKVEEARKLKPEPRDQAESGKMKQKLTEKVQDLTEKKPSKQQSAQAQMTLNQNVKRRGKTIKQKMLYLRLKWLRKEKEGKVVDDKSKVMQNESQKPTKPMIAPTPATTTSENVQHEATAPIEQVESTLVAGKFGNCLRFFKPHKKVSVPEPTEPTESTEESVLNYQMQQKKMQKIRKSPYLVTYNGKASTKLDTYPAYSYVNVKYMKNLKASKEKAAKAKCTILINAQNQKIYKDPHATPSTSSLDEYFRVLSERMTREQKEADERKPMRRRSRRGINTNPSHFNYKRAQPTIQRQYNRQRW